MANTYKNIVITPNKGSSTGDPMIVFSGANTTVNTDITLRVYPTSNGTLSFEGSAGQLFSITNDLTGTLFSVNDISGMPSIEVDANGKITLAQYSGNVGIGTGSPAYKLDVAGDMRVTGNVIMGDASTDTITINGSVISLGNNQSIDAGTLFIDATNNEVGIGTTNPTSNLHVIGTANITSSVVIGTTNVVPTIQASFLAANSAFANANTTHTLAIASFGAANASFANGNTNFTTLQTVFGVANAGFLAANSAFANANGTHTLTVASFGAANAAFANANSTHTLTIASFAAANASFANGNTNFTTLQTVFGAANAAFSNANTTHTLAIAALTQANTANNLTVANTGTVVGSRNVLNFIPGANVVITFTDDAVGNRVNVSIDSVSSGGGGSGALSYTTNIGDNSANTFNITHALNTTTVIPAVREIASGYYVYPDMKVTSPNNIVLEFVSAPTTDQYFLILLGA